MTASTALVSSANSDRAYSRPADVREMPRFTFGADSHWTSTVSSEGELGHTAEITPPLQPLAERQDDVVESDRDEIAAAGSDAAVLSLDPLARISLSTVIGQEMQYEVDQHPDEGA
jgi:hypothetical protein